MRFSPAQAQYPRVLGLRADLLCFREETKGRLCKRVVLADVPSFQFFCTVVPLLYLRSVFCTPRSGFGGSREHLPEPPFWKSSFLRTPPKVFKGFLVFLCRSSQQCANWLHCERRGSEKSTFLVISQVFCFSQVHLFSGVSSI